MRDNPSLVNLPIAVGGRPEQRGVLTTCNYPARQYGLHSAMPSSEAAKLCPDLVFIKPRFAAYKEASRQVMEILRQYSSQLEPLALDEAFLDVSHSDNASALAEEIRLAIYQQVGITVSAGVSVNKFLAKVASDWNKPDGLYVIKPHQITRFMKSLPVKRIPGVGKATMLKLEQLNIATCADLQQLPQHQLLREFGSFGKKLYDYSRGIDERPVKTKRIRKSLSVEQTYAHDLFTEQQCLHAMQQLIESFNSRWLVLEKEYQVHKLFIKLRYNDFDTLTMEQSCHHVDSAVWFELFQQMRTKKTLPVRLMGIGAGLKVKQQKQMDLFAL